MTKLVALNNTLAKVLLSNKLAIVDRTEWLTETLDPFVARKDLLRIDHMRPEELVVPEILDKLASEEVMKYTLCSSLLSGGLTFLGRLSLFTATSLDVASFWIHQIRLVQKLAYLYGWNDFYLNGTATKETLARLVALLGYGLGIHGMKKVILATSLELTPSVSMKFQNEETLLSPQEGIKLTAQHFVLGSKSLFASLVCRRSSFSRVLLAGAINHFIYRRIASRSHEVLQEVMYTRLDEEALN